ncbi:MAG: hypothetical protein IPK00_23800 [Deltaproteobacteria bacterium]|nr:hypothetical protein [Deltaproteobacteria bacterium]
MLKMLHSPSRRLSGPSPASSTPGGKSGFEIAPSAIDDQAKSPLKGGSVVDHGGGEAEEGSRRVDVVVEGADVERSRTWGAGVAGKIEGVLELGPRIVLREECGLARLRDRDVDAVEQRVLRAREAEHVAVEVDDGDVDARLAAEGRARLGARALGEQQRVDEQLLDVVRRETTGSDVRIRPGDRREARGAVAIDEDLAVRVREALGCRGGRGEQRRRDDTRRRIEQADSWRGASKGKKNSSLTKSPVSPLMPSRKAWMAAVLARLPAVGVGTSVGRLRSWPSSVKRSARPATVMRGA